jgi:Vam6/Vps39-like protein vacuolar protein sorting-associated protein 39
MAATDILMPTPVVASVPVMGAFSGLTGYMTLGLGAKPKLGVVNIGGTEVLITKDSEIQGLTWISRPLISL